MLNFLRRKYGLRSFNDVTEYILLKDLGLPNDMFGVDRSRVKPFSREDRTEVENGSFRYLRLDRVFPEARIKGWLLRIYY